MILLFPDLDTLRLCLTSDTVPADVTLAPAAVSTDKLGRIYLEPTVSLSKSTAKLLDRIGVKGTRRHANESVEQVCCWIEVIPAVKEPGTPNLASQTAVLFELESADDLPTLVTEMLRLGNDRQSFRWFAAPQESDGKRVLLRVVGPPYYTLLRAIDRTSSDSAGVVRAYLERGPHVWVEIGYSHPFSSQIRVAEGQFLLIREPRHWLFLDETDFQDVYDVLHFQLPASPVEWTESDDVETMEVPLRLTAGNASDVAEFWVIRERPMEQLDAFVRDVEDRLAQRLMFAVATDTTGETVVVLRTRPSKLAPPVLTLEGAIGFKPFWKLPNLFLPTGRRLHPTLRRDAVRQLLASDPDEVIWLYPDADGNFTPESVPDAAFRALEDWVEYVIETEQAPLAAWMDATRFEFSHFICQDSGNPKPKPDRDEQDGTTPEVGTSKVLGPQPRQSAKTKGQPRSVPEFVPTTLEVKQPNEWKLKLDDLEQQFLAAEGGLESEERQSLWPELARANAGLGSQAEAAVCWLNAMWESEATSFEWLRDWVRSELPQIEGALRADDLDRRLAAKSPSPADSRAVVAGFLWMSCQSPMPAWLKARLPAVQKFIEAHENTLPVRAVWLTALRLAQLSGSDILGLARVRDRLLQRLLDQGLSAERDIPNFLRYAGLKDSERLRGVREKTLELHKLARKWLEQSAKAQKNEGIRRTEPYVDLLFAFALAKLGEVTHSRALFSAARAALGNADPTEWADGKNVDQAAQALVAYHLFRCYEFRIEQALTGKPHSGALHPDLLAAIEDVGMKGKNGPINNAYSIAEYAIARLRAESRVLEPQERLDPYKANRKEADAILEEAANLPLIREPARLAERTHHLLRGAQSSGNSNGMALFAVLYHALPVAPRVSERFTVELLDLVPRALREYKIVGPEPADAARTQGELLQRSLFCAGHFDRVDLVQKLVGEFIDLIHARPELSRYRLIKAVAGECIRSLRKLGLRDEIDRFLNRLQEELLRGHTLAELRKRASAKPEVWCALLQCHLYLASGWLSFGLTAQAVPILDEARSELLGTAGTKFTVTDFTELGQAYVIALSQASTELALPRVAELFQSIDSKRITNTMTTAQSYSRLHLKLIEEVVLTLVQDSFALGPAGRRWLDDDEFLVRHRIHVDMKRERERHGL